MNNVMVRFMSELSEKFAARLNELCDEMGIPAKGRGRQFVLGQRFVKTQGAARKWLTGEAWPSMEILIAMCEWAQVRLDWLCSGRGEKYLSTAVP